jgi:hypothetical protein
MKIVVIVSWLPIVADVDMALGIFSCLRRGGWQTYPTQVWYEDFISQYHCPIAKKVVDFCDEPDFSKVAMYLSGREYLDEKDKVIEFAGRFMPKTFCIDNGNGLEMNHQLMMKRERWMHRGLSRKLTRILEGQQLPS